MASAARLVVATGNPGKLDEYRELLDGGGVELVGHHAAVAEDGDTYEENALLKARAAAQATGLPAIGDDSGIEADALGGFPGLRSARVAPEQPERTRILLSKLEGKPRPWRARFVCAVALAWPDGRETVARGESEGEVVPEERGRQGFGYDPVFLVPELGRTFAELSSREKHRWSHRGRAVEALRATGALDPILGPG